MMTNRYYLDQYPRGTFILVDSETGEQIGKGTKDKDKAKAELEKLNGAR